MKYVEINLEAKVKRLWLVKLICYTGMPLVLLRVINLEKITEFAARFIKVDINETRL